MCKVNVCITLGGNCLKSTGVVRKVDELGRIVMPIELRRTLGIEVKDPMEIYVDGERIVLAKYQPACVFCGNVAEVAEYKGKPVCASCTNELQNTLNQG
ncbi:MAG: AbrB family transcriptional regulator [Alicyclobacillus sp. RIFOXYA1_FULL_53_8]|nr:MAG: AbrB family transcriptional regulator [Alicyclobacillus sp. RIFOXYA1_FULL_53_8]